MDCSNEIATNEPVRNFALVRALFGQAKKLTSTSVTKIVSMVSTTPAAKSTKPAKKPLTGKPSKKKPEPEPEPEPDSEPEVASDAEEEGEESEGEAGSGDEGSGEENDDDDAVSDEEEVKTAGKSEAQIKEETEDREARSRLKARRRGYRIVANKAGYSQEYVSSAPHFDVAVPVVSINETIRACNWAPRVTDKDAYEGLEEFEERTLLSHEPLPNSAAAVIRAHGETYLRRLTQGTMQRMSDMTKKSANINMVMAETRPLQRAQKYTFVAPKGLVRWNQTAGPRERLPMFPEDQVDAKNNKSMMDKQTAFAKEQQKKADDAREERKQDREEAKRLRDEALDRGEAPPKMVKKPKKKKVALVE